MGLRFRRSIRIAPGVRMNFGKSGFSSWSFGGRGYRTTINSRGVRRSVGIPGTGLSYSTFSSRTRKAQGMSVQRFASAPSLASVVVPDRFGITRPIAPVSAGLGRLAMFVVGGVLFVTGTATAIGDLQFVGLGVMGAGFLLRSRTAVQRRLDSAHTEAIAVELKRRIDQFKAATTAALGSAAALREAIALGNRLELTDADIGNGVVAELDAQAALLEFQDSVAANRGHLAQVTGCERVVGNEACYFVAKDVLYDKRGDDDPTGSLYLTDEGSFFVASTLTHKTPWSKVISIVRDGRILRLQRRDRQTPTDFWCDSNSDAAVGAHVATLLWSK